MKVKRVQVGVLIESTVSQCNVYSYWQYTSLLGWPWNALGCPGRARHGWTEKTYYFRLPVHRTNWTKVTAIEWKSALVHRTQKHFQGLRLQPQTWSGDPPYTYPTLYSSSQINNSNFSRGANFWFLSLHANTDNAFQQISTHTLLSNRLQMGLLFSVPAEGDFIPTTIVWVIEDSVPYVSAQANLISASEHSLCLRVAASVRGEVWRMRLKSPNISTQWGSHLFISHYYLSQHLFDCFRLIHSGVTVHVIRTRHCRLVLHCKCNHFFEGKHLSLYPSAPPTPRHCLYSSFSVTPPPLLHPMCITPISFFMLILI